LTDTHTHRKLIMKKLYIVIKQGCLKYVSTNSKKAAKNMAVILVDLDDPDKSERDEANIAIAEKLTRIY